MAKISGLKPNSSPFVISLIAVCTVFMLQGCKGHSKKVALPDTPAPVAQVQSLPPAAPQGLAVSASTKTLHFNWPSLTSTDYYRLLENSDGVSGFTQKGGDITATSFSFDIAAHLFDWPDAAYMLEACNAQGCTQSTEVSAMNTMLDAIGYFKPDSTPANVDNYFGVSLALSADGNTMAVSVPYDDSAATGINGNLSGSAITNSGAVYVYRRNGSSWLKEAYIKASNAGASDFFGLSVAISADGNTLAVGANGESSSAIGVNGDQANNDVYFSGAAYVFKRTNTNWVQHAYLKASNPDVSDSFGMSIALSGDGNTLAVSALFEDSNASGIDGLQSNNLKSAAGAVYVFTQVLDAWSQQAYIKSSNPDSNDQFGNSVSLSANGNTLAVSAYWEDSNGINADQLNNLAHQSGAAYVFARDGNNWSQQAYLKASNARAHAYFGTSLSLAADGNTLAISSFEESSNATVINGDQSNTTAPGSGAVYVFERAALVWSQQSYLKAANAESNDRFGYNLSLSANGNTLAVGATNEDSAGTGLFANQWDNSASGSGAAYVFTRSASTWVQASYVKAPNANAADEFGRTVAVSTDGSVLAIGAVGEASNATGINGDRDDNSLNYAGAVYLY